MCGHNEWRQHALLRNWALKWESGGQTPREYQSKPKASRLRPVSLQRDKPALSELTMRGDHSANAPGEGQGETDSPETSCMPGGRQLGWQEEAFGTAARTLLSHERSRLALEFLVGCLRARGWTKVILGFCSIQQLT
jgi:hypothetical protein